MGQSMSSDNPLDHPPDLTRYTEQPPDAFNTGMEDPLPAARTSTGPPPEQGDAPAEQVEQLPFQPDPLLMAQPHPVLLPTPPPPFAPPQRQWRPRPAALMTAWDVAARNAGQHARPEFRDDDPLHTAAAAAAGAEPDPDVSEEGPLSLTARVEYAAMVKGQTQSIFGLITLQASESQAVSEPSAERQPMDLVCVLDVSGSMMGNKIAEVKNAVRFIIDEARASDRLSIITFSSDACRELPLRRMDAAGKDEATVAVLRLTAGGGTAIASGVELALDVVEQRRQRNKVTALLLLTDGRDGSTNFMLPSLTQRASRAGASIYAFGFGEDHDAQLLREVSELAHTPYTFVESTDSVGEAFAGVVGGLSSIMAQQVQLTLDCKVHLKEVNTAFQVEKEGNQKAVVTIPDVFAGERRDILVELEVPATLEGTRADGSTPLLEATAQYLDLRRGSTGLPVRTVPVEMSIRRVDEPQPELEPDSEVQDQRERVEVTRTLEQATSICNKGGFDEAQKLLEDQRSRVSRRTTPIAQALTADLVSAQERMRSRQLWETSGRASVTETIGLHTMQRSTNAVPSRSCTTQVASKTMYMSSATTSWTERSRTYATAPACMTAPAHFHRGAKTTGVVDFLRSRTTDDAAASSSSVAASAAAAAATGGGGGTPNP